MRIGIMGGTFNPPHNGHLNAARAAKAALSLDKLIIIPAGIPPHKEMAENSASTFHRLEMANLLAKELSAEVSDIEISREGKSFTVDTLASLRKSYQSDELWLIIGTDMLLSFETWREFREIFKTAKIAAVPRKDDDFKKLLSHSEYLKGKYGAEIRVIETAAVDVASSELRPEIAGGKLCGMIPKPVYDYIVEHKLYGVSEVD